MKTVFVLCVIICVGFITALAKDLPCTASVISVDTIATKVSGKSGDKNMIRTKVTATIAPGEALCFEVKDVNSTEGVFTFKQPIKYSINFDKLELHHRIVDLRPICTKINMGLTQFCDCAGYTDGNVCGYQFGFPGSGYKDDEPTSNSVIGWHEKHTHVENCKSASALFNPYSNTCYTLRLSCDETDDTQMFDIDNSYDMYGSWSIVRELNGSSNVLQMTGLATTGFSAEDDDRVFNFENHGQFHLQAYEGSDRIYKNSAGFYRVDKEMWNGFHSFDPTKGDWYKGYTIHTNGVETFRYDPVKLKNSFICHTTSCQGSKVSCIKNVVDNSIEKMAHREFSEISQAFGKNINFDLNGEVFKYEPISPASSMISIEIDELTDLTFIKEQASVGGLVCTGMNNLDSLSYIHCYIYDITAAGRGQISIKINGSNEYVFDITVPRTEQYNFTHQVVYGGNKTIQVCLITEDNEVCSDVYLVKLVEDGWNPCTIIGGNASDPPAQKSSLMSKIISYLKWLNPLEWFSGGISLWNKLIGAAVDIAIIVIIILLIRCCIQRYCRKRTLNRAVQKTLSKHLNCSELEMAQAGFPLVHV